ncbi:hypothetical protein DFH11DRAFT_1544693 [Phellopilus nigrolimitatus]|nr:hypothetical protein DFH11DRAFT_1544693 [Phellopilus nigrolimitatus]
MTSRIWSNDILVAYDGQWTLNKKVENGTNITCQTTNAVNSSAFLIFTGKWIFRKAKIRRSDLAKGTKITVLGDVPTGDGNVTAAYSIDGGAPEQRRNYTLCSFEIVTSGVHGKNDGLIAGSVMGGVIFAMLVILGFLFWRSKRVRLNALISSKSTSVTSNPGLQALTGMNWNHFLVELPPPTKSK